ncbi:thiamine pyrophosphate-binding protein [bacterium]|nr:thiamine pyrophosphate-binding protein [bacterium]
MTTKLLLQEEVTVSEAIIRVLEEAGIDMVFGIPGGNTGGIFNALYDHRSTIRTVLVRQESLAAVMAEVYGRLTGKPGVAIGQCAFMLSNAMLGTLEAYCGSSPMLILTDLSDGAPFSHHAPYQAGTGDYRTWDAKRCFGGVTKISMELRNPVQAVQGTQLGIKHALTGERGPVALLYHSSALSSNLGPNSVPRIYSTQSYLPTTSISVDAALVDTAAQTISQANRPVIIAGNGVRISQAYRQLQDFAELIGAPVATTASGKGVFPENHPLALGVFGNFGLRVANKVVGDADTVIVVGSKLAPSDTARQNPKILDPQRQSFIQIDIEPRNAGWTFPCDHVVIGDAAVALSQLSESIRDLRVPSEDTLNVRKDSLAEAKKEYGFFDNPDFSSEEVPLIPQRIVAEIRNAIADDVMVLSDAGENRLFMTHWFQTRKAGTFMSPAATGGMGYAIPAALATKLIFPERKVVATTGDGGFAMSMNGLMTACEENIPIVVVVFNNSALGWVRHGQVDRAIASEFSDMNFAKIAEAIGCHGRRIERPGQLEKALSEAIESDEPTVLDVVTSMKTTFRDVSGQF